MGNTNGVLWHRPDKPSYGSALFHALDVSANGYLTLKDLMDAPAPGLMLPHSLPALYFFDVEKNGRLTEEEFTSLAEYCRSEKCKVEEALSHDKSFRDLILRASKAGVKDCSAHGRSSYRRLSSYSKVRSVFCSRRDAHGDAASSTSSLPHIVSPKTSHQRSNSHLTLPSNFVTTSHDDLRSSSPTDSASSDSDHVKHALDPPAICESQPISAKSSVAMYSSPRNLDHIATGMDPVAVDACSSDPDLRNPQNRTAVDVAVLENIINASIHKLADLLHTEGSREKFMAWLWELADFNSSEVVTLEELRVFLAALSEDGIDLEELAFDKEGGEPLEVCIINEFDTTHAGLLSRDEFMVLADLVTREYEFWENRHLERIGDYELGRTIGRGSSGIVRLAFHVENRQKFAIKIIKKGKCSDLSRLDREIQSLMAAKHEHIVALEEVLESENNIFIVMELCGGGSMVDIVRLYPEERMPEDTARFFMRQVFEALSFCHENGICHRDVRLDNVMLDNTGKVKITDFGHSGMYTPGWDIFQTSLVGSVYNLSPEQVLGQVYSGEKIDIWSAGVAVYCLLVGHPPFYDPDVNSLLHRIAECSYEVPDFVSEKASDLIECMIRAVPDERISVSQMLHHPWFYAGPEYGPSMNVVVFPVDEFYKKRPDIAEMILAMTIYQHNLHFHLADIHNPKTPRDDSRCRDWTLRCLCPKNDIKFTVSLCTKTLQSIKRKKKIVSISSSASSTALLPESARAIVQEIREMANASGDPRCSLPGFSPRISQRICTDMERKSTITVKSELPITQCFEGTGDVSSARPPLQRKNFKVTPMEVAAHIRASSATGAEFCDPFDFEPDEKRGTMMMCSFQEDMLRKRATVDDSVKNGEPKREQCGSHSRSHSLDRSTGLRRINRSATVDAFPYQKVYPQRKMPESARNLDFGKPDGMTIDRDDAVSYEVQCGSAPMTPTYLERTDSSSGGDDLMRSPNVLGVRDGEIALKLMRHPSKTVSPQSPQVGRLGTNESRGDMEQNIQHRCTGDNVEELEGRFDSHDEEIEEQIRQQETKRAGCNYRDAETDESMQPFIEVRLQDGESGLFLKICRKLKTICSTKLGEVAQRRKNKKTGGRRSLTTLRRTASARSIESDSDVTADDVEKLAHGALRNFPM